LNGERGSGTRKKDTWISQQQQEERRWHEKPEPGERDGKKILMKGAWVAGKWVQAHKSHETVMIFGKKGKKRGRKRRFDFNLWAGKRPRLWGNGKLGVTRGVRKLPKGSWVGEGKKHGRWIRDEL